MECIFCSIINKKREAAYIYDDGDFVAILDKYPINIGHTLVLPKKHYSVITEMHPNEIAILFTLTIHLTKSIIQAVKADGFSIGQNNGEAANQLIPHVHVHIIPRFVNDMTKWSSRRFVTTKQLNQIAENIKRFIKPIEIKELL